VPIGPAHRVVGLFTTKVAAKHRIVGLVEDAILQVLIVRNHDTRSVFSTLFGLSDPVQESQQLESLYQ